MKPSSASCALAIGVLFSLAGLATAQPRPDQPPLQQRFPLLIEPLPSTGSEDIRRADDAFRAAKLSHDTAALKTMLADDFFETDQDGNTRNKEQFVERLAASAIQSLTVDSIRVKVAGDYAFATGSQTEGLAANSERTYFMRVYVKSGTDWRLLVSLRSRKP